MLIKQVKALYSSSTHNPIWLPMYSSILLMARVSTVKLRELMAILWSEWGMICMFSLELNRRIKLSRISLFCIKIKLILRKIKSAKLWLLWDKYKNLFISTLHLYDFDKQLNHKIIYESKMLRNLRILHIK